MSGFVEVLPPELTGPDHEEWFAARAQGITASEIAAVLGVSPYESPFSLYWRKRGVLGEQADTDAMRWGRRLEPLIAEEFQERHLTDFQVRRAGLYSQSERPWQMASPDRACHEYAEMDLSVSADPVALAECKVTGSWDGWGPDGSDEVPLHIRCQVIWQADVLGVPCVYVPVVNGRSYREYVVAYDATDAGLMRWKALDFLQLLATGTPPDVDGSDATLATLREIHPDLDDTEAEVPARLAAQWLAAARAEKRARERRKAAEAKLRDRMGRARVAVHGGEKVATRVISTVREHVRAESTRDYLNPPRESA